MGNDGASLRRGGCELSCAAAVAAERERALPSHPPARPPSFPRSGRAITMSTEQDMIIHREREGEGDSVRQTGEIFPGS